MADKTINYGLTKPLGSEFYNVNVQNENMDIIDNKLKEVETALENVAPEFTINGKSPDEDGVLTLTPKDVSAMTQSDYMVYSKYTTVLEASCALPTSGTFIAISGHNLINAEDSPFPSTEVQYFVLVDSVSRRTVIAVRYGNGVEFVKIRNIFNGRWISTNWKEVFMADGSVAMSGSLEIDSAVPFVMAKIAGNTKGVMFGTAGSGALMANRNNLDSSDTYRAVMVMNSDEQSNVAESIRLQDRVAGKNNYYQIFGEHNVTKGTTPLTAGTSSLGKGCIYLRYE